MVKPAGLSRASCAQPFEGTRLSAIYGCEFLFCVAVLLLLAAPAHADEGPSETSTPVVFSIGVGVGFPETELLVQSVFIDPISIDLSFNGVAIFSAGARLGVTYHLMSERSADRTTHAFLVHAATGFEAAVIQGCNDSTNGGCSPPSLLWVEELAVGYGYKTEGDDFRLLAGAAYQLGKEPHDTFFPMDSALMPLVRAIWMWRL